MKELFKELVDELCTIFLIFFIMFIVLLFLSCYDKLSSDNQYKILMLLIIFK